MNKLLIGAILIGSIVMATMPASADTSQTAANVALVTPSLTTLVTPSLPAVGLITADTSVVDVTQASAIDTTQLIIQMAADNDMLDII